LLRPEAKGSVVFKPEFGVPVIPRPRVTSLLFALIASIVVGACSAAPVSSPASATAAASAVAIATPAATPTVAPTATPTAAPAFPATLTDDEGTAVTIPAEPAKIVSLTPAATETLFALGAGNRLVGKVEDFSVYPPEAAKVPDVAKFGSVDVEKIVAMGTQLVIAGGSNFNPPEAIAKLRSLGVPTLVIFAPDVAGALKDIGLVGAAVGKAAEAKTLTTSISTAFDQVKAATAGTKPLRVYYELDATNGYFGPAPDYFGTEMIRVAGGQPLTSGTNGVYQIDAEKILAFDPEVILLGDAAYGVTPAQVAKRPGWDKLTAVKNGAVRPINDVIVTRPGPRLGEGIRELALAIHPDLVLPSPAPSGG
jgi:iron complex transport system substrate-binding protein